jgi:phenylalanyl-tRNA synthetase alpha chain
MNEVVSQKELEDRLRAFQEAALSAFQAARTAAEVEEARVRYLGQRRGQIRELEESFRQLSPEAKRACGPLFNEVKRRVQEAFEEARRRTASQATAAGDVRPSVAVPSPVQADRSRGLSRIDLTLPGLRPPRGTIHPLSQTIDELVDLFGRLGFALADGPEIEDPWHNFEALNIPPEHPARDPEDNFYIDEGRLLRSQTSTIQIRVMEQMRPPVRVIAVGRVYRPDVHDAVHFSTFHQIEGLYVDRHVTLAHLKTVLRTFVQAYLGPEVQIRFRPSFFPFTEPSVEVDMSWDVRGGQWVELGGAGMVDPNVLTAVGYDPELYSGFAFGLGVERLCMRKHGVNDIRLFWENDVRFLRQF